MKKLLLGTALLMSASSAFAINGNPAGTFSVTPGAGYYFFDHSRGVGDTPMADASFGYNFTDNWGAELFVGGMNPNSNTNAGNNNFSGRAFFLDGLYHFPNQTNFEPFVMAGVGMLTLAPNQQLTPNNPLYNEPSTQANMNAGAGVQYFFSPLVAFRTDVRDIYSTTNTSGNNDVLVNFGVSFVFGGK